MKVWVVWRDNDTFDFEINEIIGVFSTIEAAEACADSWDHGDNLNNWISAYIMDVPGRAPGCEDVEAKAS